MVIALAWCGGLLVVFGAIAVRMQRGCGNECPRRTAQPLVSQTGQHAGRLLTRWRREPGVLVQSLFFPTFLLVVYKWVIGESILKLTGDDSLYGLVPMCAIAGALFGALGTGVAIPEERESGY